MITIIAITIILLSSIAFSLVYIISLQPATLSLRIGDKAYKICGIFRMSAMLFEITTIAGYILFVFGEYCTVKISSQNDILVRIIGIVITVVTLGFMFMGVFASGKEAALPSKGTKLYKGIYMYMRHPQTLGEMLSWFGISLILNSLTLFLYSLVWIPIFLSYTILEDNDLSFRFGPDYIEYTKKVGIFWKKQIY